MARIRSVHPSLFTDEAWVSCSPLARVLYIGLWTDADDQGLFEWKPLQLKMRLLPGDGADVAVLLAELTEVDLVKAFEVDGKRYGAVKDFRKFQRPQKPNAIHPLPENIREYVCLTAPDPKPVADQSRTGTGKSPQMEDGEEDGKEKNCSPDGESQPKPDPLPVREAFELWNKLAERLRLPVAKDLTETRRKHIKARLSASGIEGWMEALTAVEASPMCRGQNDRGWRADLDFICQPKSFAKLREGSYAADGKPRPHNTPPAAPSAMSAALQAERRAMLEAEDA